MILVDANIALYAYDSSSAQHKRAKSWLEVALAGPEPVRFAWVTLLAFVRISTNVRVFESPSQSPRPLRTFVPGLRCQP